MSENANATDLQLLARYTRDHAEDAFAELVRRHVDLVHSAALRQVRSPQLAEEVAQSAFTDLARNAAKLKSDTVLTAWLYQVTRRTAIDAVRREARRQLREQIATEMNAMNETAHFAKCANTPEWADIEQHLDEAMSALDETDRAAILLRYFENKSLREVGATLGTSDDAAQKRVSRAVERLREFFAKRGVTAGASGLTIVISANAVQAAPVGLAVTISTAAATIAGTTIATTTTATATAAKAIAMTTLQKAFVTTIIAAVVGAGIYEARQASNFQIQVQTLQQRQVPLNEEIQRLQRERDDATSRLASLTDELTAVKSNTSELPRLRGEVTRLRQDSQELPRLKAKLNQFEDRQAAQMKSFRELQEREALTLLQSMKEGIKLTPDQEQALKGLLLKRADLIVQNVQALGDGNEKEFREPFSQSMSNLTAQIDAVFSPEQQADYKAIQQSGQVIGARLRAAGEMVMMQNLVGIDPEQQDQIYSVLYNFALKRKAEDSSDDPEKADALTPVLTHAQMEQYRKFMQGKRVTTQITYPTE